jgi:NOL1/NOP2/fmu family ribosome biogenesis protein
MNGRVPFGEIDGSPYVEWWQQRFEPADSPFEGMCFYVRGKSRIWVGTADVESLVAAHTETVGLHLLRVSRRVWKPTSAAMVAFGSSARANVIDMSGDELVGFLAGKALRLDEADERRGLLSRGFVVARYNGVAVGCGEWHERDFVASRIAKNKRVSEIDL